MRFKIRFSLLFLFIGSASVFAQFEQIRVACIGNSITQGNGGTNTYPAQMGIKLGAHYNVKNYGIGGRTLLKKGDFPYWNEAAFLTAQDFNPHIIIIKLGTNDSKSWNWIYKDEFFSDYLEFVNTFRKNGKNPQIFLCRPCPVVQDNFGIRDTVVHYEIIPLVDSLRTLLQTDMVDFYTPFVGHPELFADGVHPTNVGYEMMGEIAKDAVLNSPTGRIYYFNAKPLNYELGDSTILYWETSAGSPVKINGQDVSSMDSMIVYPSGNPTFNLTTGGDYPDTLSLTLNYVAPGIIKSFTANHHFLDLGSGDSTEISWTTANGSTVTFEGESVPQNGSIKVAPTSTTTYHILTNSNESRESRESREITIQVIASSLINRAIFNKSVSSTTLRESSTTYAFDGDTSTVWESETANTQWIYVDLGQMHNIDRIVLKWGNVFAQTYSIQTLDDKNVTKSIYSKTGGDGDVDDITGLTGKGKLVRLLCNVKNNSASGYLLKEFEVYGTKITPTSVHQFNNEIPSEFILEQNFPNPFNPTTQIRYSIPVLSDVKISVTNLLGQTVRESFFPSQNQGNYEFSFLGETLPSGVYFYSVTAKSLSENQPLSLTKKMILMK